MFNIYSFWTTASLTADQPGAFAVTRTADSNCHTAMHTSYAAGCHPIQVFQVALVVKNLPANAGDAGDMGSPPGLGRSPGGRHENPLQYSCLQNPYGYLWIEETGRLQFIGSQSIGHNWRGLAGVLSYSLYTVVTIGYCDLSNKRRQLKPKYHQACFTNLVVSQSKFSL